MSVYYESVTTNWSSTPKGGRGTRNIVRIKGSKGKKIQEELNRSGKVVKRHVHTLKNKEIKQITQGKFIPGLWRGITRRQRRN